MSVVDDNWNYFINLDEIEEKFNWEFNEKLKEWQELIANKLEKAFKTQKINNGTTHVNQDDELKDIINKNQELRHKIDKELQDISHLQNHYETYKKDQELLSQEIKDTHESFIMGKKIYKKYLNIYYTIESRESDKQVIFVQFFTESKKESEKYSVRLLRRIHMGHGSYEILNTTPELDILAALQSKLRETNDVPGALCAIRESFLNIRNKQK